MKKVQNIRIGISGMRGIVGDTLTPEIAIHFTRAFATLLGSGRVAVARDSRPSGDAIKRAVFSALLFSGVQPIDTGTLPTPSLQIYVREKKLNGGIIITASHNPEEWNGLKFVGASGLFLYPFIAVSLIDIYHQGVFARPLKNEFPAIVAEKDAFAVHARRILRIVDGERIRRRKFRVLADPGGGVGALFDRNFLERLGCQVEMIHGQTGTHFPRKPEPIPENLGRASAFMKKNAFAIGFAQDADGDRLSLLDENGKALGGEITLALALAGYLAQGKPGPIVVNLSTSRICEYVARRHGARLLRVPVGEINVVERMLKEKAVAGGEGNGGVIIPRVHPCRDSFTGMALILDLLARGKKPLSRLVADLPAYRMVMAKIPFSKAGAYRLLTRLAEEFPQADRRDGLRVEQGESWFHIRSSNTEPVLRIVAEGPGEEAQIMVAALREKIAKWGAG